jgi:phosphoserine aminotransferase
MLILSPNAVRRLESYKPDRPLPKLFRMTKGGKLNEALFEGNTINTPSLLCTEDYLQALDWAEECGGYQGLKARSDRSLEILENWVAKTDWIEFLCADDDVRSNSGVTLSIVHPTFVKMDEPTQRDFIKRMMKRLEDEEACFDANGYAKAPPGLRIWCGATVEPDDVAKLTPWLEWTFAEELAVL